RHPQRDAGQDPLLDDVRVLQPDVLPPVRGWLPRHAAPRTDLRSAPPGAERLRLVVRLHPRVFDADLPREPRVVTRLRARSRRGEPVGLAPARVAGPAAGSG